MEDRRSQGVAATNQEFIRYDQVEKRQTYHLSETADGAEAFDEQYAIRTCDLGRFLRGGEADRRAFVAELGEALRDIGFAVLEGRGRMWGGRSRTAIGRGSCVFLPRRQVHCVENLGPGPLRLLGVFYPAGSPAARVEKHRTASSTSKAKPRK